MEIQKLNQLDKDGFYIVDYILGVSGMTPPEYWTADVVDSGFYKAQYQNAEFNSDTGEFSNGEWVETGVIPPVDYIAIHTMERDSLMANASSKIAPLQDAVDLDIATDEEVALLKQWKLYRVQLNRLVLVNSVDQVWPEQPE